MKSFGISDNSCMFVTDSRQESFITNEETAFFMLLSDVPYLTNKLLKSLRIAVLRCMQLVLGGIREASSFLYFINFKFHTQMPRANENLNEGTNVASLSSTANARKASTLKTEKLLKQLSEKVINLQQSYEQKCNECAFLRYFIARNMPTAFSCFEKEHPIDSQNWGKLYKMETQLKNI